MYRNKNRDSLYVFVRIVWYHWLSTAMGRKTIRDQHVSFYCHHRLLVWPVPLATVQRHVLSVSLYLSYCICHQRREEEKLLQSCDEIFNACQIDLTRKKTHGETHFEDPEDCVLLICGQLFKINCSALSSVKSMVKVQPALTNLLAWWPQTTLFWQLSHT